MSSLTSFVYSLNLSRFIYVNPGITTMKKLLFSENNIPWLPQENVVDTYLSDEMPPVELCSSMYSITFKDGSLLLSDLREGERKIRMLDIPGGHVDYGETPEDAVLRETFEETGVHVKILKLAAFKEIKIIGPKPETWRYSYPIGYMLFYICEVVEETDFNGNEETHGREWLPLDKFEMTPWTRDNKVMLDEIIKNI
jgi:8-oxo-dGTP diphosphatase